MGDPEEDDFDLTDRPRGIITKQDRQFLKGELDKELSQGAKYQKRYKIRERVTNAIFDFYFLPALPDDDIDSIFELFLNREKGRAAADFTTAVTLAIMFFQAGLAEDFNKHVESVVEARIEEDRAIENEEFVDVDATIDVRIKNTLSKEQVIQRLEHSDNPEEEYRIELNRAKVYNWITPESHPGLFDDDSG